MLICCSQPQGDIETAFKDADRGWSPTMKKNFDAIVIGTGQSGPFLAVRMAAAGQRVAIIERGRFGGTCVNTGCIPTKTLVASAYAAHMSPPRGGIRYPIGGADMLLDMKRVKARKDEITGKSRSAIGIVAQEHAELHGVPGACVLRIVERGAGGRGATDGAADFHQRGSARGDTVHARSGARRLI